MLVEVALAAGLWALGLGWDLGAGAAVDLALTAIWIVAVVNAFNLFDNMDGAASSMAAVVAAGLAVVGVVEGDTWLAVTGAALCGAALGFLPHNLFASPARIFLGDGGSMPLGFAVAAIAMIGVSASTAAWQSLAMGLLLVGIPALDTALVTVSRRRRGVSILTGGRDHLTHRARRRLRNARAVAVTLGGAQAVISALAVVALRNGSAGIVVAVVAYLVGLGRDDRAARRALRDAPAQAADADPATGREPWSRGRRARRSELRVDRAARGARDRDRPQPVLLRLLRRDDLGAGGPRRARRRHRRRDRAPAARGRARRGLSSAASRRSACGRWSRRCGRTRSSRPSWRATAGSPTRRSRWCSPCWSAAAARRSRCWRRSRSPPSASASSCSCG